MATLLHSSARRKAPATGSTITDAILTAGVKALNAIHPHSSESDSGADVAISTGDDSLKEAPEHIVDGSVVHESSIADPSDKITSTSYNTTYYPVKINPTGHDNTRVYDKPKHGYERLYEKLKSGWDRVFITEEQKHVLHRDNHDDEPSLSSDFHLRTFIGRVTELTISIVTKQCTDEIALLIGSLVANQTRSMEVRIKLIVGTITGSLCLEDSMTACHNLNEIKEKFAYPRHHEHFKYGHDGSDRAKYPHNAYPRDYCDPLEN